MKNQIFALTFVAVFLCASVGFASRQPKGLEDTLAFLKSTGQLSEESSTVALFDLKGISLEKMTDEVFEYLVPLCKLENIEFLDFRFNQMTGAGLKLVAERCGSWPSVQSIDFGGNPLVDVNLRSLSAFPNLERLNIDFHGEGKSAVDGSFLRETPLPKLKSLWATGTSFSDENALLILDLPALEVFCFGERVVLSRLVLEHLNAKKINFSQKPWDLRRIKYEEKRAGQCYDKINAPEHDKNLEFGISNSLITEEVSIYIKSSDLQYEGWQDHKGRIHSMICKSALTNPDEL